MICVSIGRGRHRHMIAEHRHLASQGAKLVELRLDYLTSEVNIKRLLADRFTPVIISCRRPRDGGKFAGTEEQRLLLLRTAIAEGVDYIDLEEDIANQIPRFGVTKRIISFHDFRKTPEDLELVHGRLCGLDPDYVKICTMANHPSDNLRMMRLVKTSKVPVIGLCMGDIGTMSRLLCGKFGSPISYATFHAERVLAPGQLSFEQMTEIFRYDQINDQTEVYGVIADPVGHSLSPLIHNAAFAQLGLNKVYVPVRVPREDLSRFIDEAPELGFCGLSVTIPHKEGILGKLTDPEPAVLGIGACNTVVWKDGKRFGYNADCQAAMASLEEAILSGKQDSSLRLMDNPLRGKLVLVLGAGGVGKAIVYGLLQRGAQVVVTDGDPMRATQLAHRFKCRSIEWTLRHNVSSDVLVNCTPVGMHPNVDESPFPKHHLRPSMVVFDVVYNPESTLLIKDARERTCKIVTGVDMFVRQACMQFKLFTGHEGPSDLMRAVIKRATAAAKV